MLTTVASSTTMNCARQAITSTSHGLTRGSELRGEAAVALRAVLLW